MLKPETVQIAIESIGDAIDHAHEVEEEMNAPSPRREQLEAAMADLCKAQRELTLLDAARDLLEAWDRGNLGEAARALQRAVDDYAGEQVA